MKTGQQIVTDIIGLLRGTEIARTIGGSIYRQGTRPRSSKSEDMVIIFTEGDAEQFQAGLVTINVFVPDIPTTTDGVFVPNSGRCEEIEAASARSVESIKNVSNYRLSLRDAIYTMRDEEINQSFVVIRLNFKYFD